MFFPWDTSLLKQAHTLCRTTAYANGRLSGDTSGRKRLPAGAGGSRQEPVQVPFLFCAPVSRGQSPQHAEGEGTDGCRRQPPPPGSGSPRPGCPVCRASQHSVHGSCCPQQSSSPGAAATQHPKLSGSKRQKRGAEVSADRAPADGAGGDSLRPHPGSGVPGPLL